VCVREVNSVRDLVRGQQAKKLYSSSVCGHKLTE
jgi:hypothetical protein